MPDDDHDTVIRLQMRIEALEVREKKMEHELSEINAAMRIGKGALFGIIFILGSAGIAVGTGIKRLWGMG